MILEAFWDALGAQALPKNHQKWLKMLQKSILGRVWDTSLFESGFWEGFGKVLGGFWEDFGMVWGGFWENFGRALEGF